MYEKKLSFTKCSENGEIGSLGAGGCAVPMRPSEPHLTREGRVRLAAGHTLTHTIAKRANNSAKDMFISLEFLWSFRWSDTAFDVQQKRARLRTDNLIANASADMFGPHNIRRDLMQSQTQGKSRKAATR